MTLIVIQQQLTAKNHFKEVSYHKLWKSILLVKVSYNKDNCLIENRYKEVCRSFKNWRRDILNEHSEIQLLVANHFWISQIHLHRFRKYLHKVLYRERKGAIIESVYC